MNIHNEEVLSGTARLLHELKTYEDLEREYGAVAAQSIGARACVRAGFDVTPEEFGAFVKVSSAFFTGGVSLDDEDTIQKAAADRIVREQLAKSTKYPVSKIRSVAESLR